MKILEYRSLKEKTEVFANHKIINSINELRNYLKEAESFDKNYIFRGVCEAKYKNFTSAQRKYIVNDLEKSVEIDVLIQKQIESVRREHKFLLSKYYKSLGIVPNDFLYLGIAQHYGGISPLLDFTTDLKTALFFMADGAVFPQQGTDDDIGNYSSLYLISNSDLKNFNGTLRNIAEKVSEKINKEVGENELDIDRQGNIISLLADFRLFKGAGEAMYLIPNKMESYIIPIKGQDRGLSGVLSISNLNIVAQEGCFVFYFPKKPLSPFEQPLQCIDIHKSLLPYINEYTKLKKNDVYPDEYDLVEDSCNKALRNILN